MKSDLLHLTQREKDVFYQLSKGITNREISTLLGIQECTVKAHISKLLSKHSAKNRTELLCILTTNNPRPTNTQKNLTRRENEIVQYIVTGYLDKEISYELDIKISTVKKHVSTILRKMKVSNRTQLACLIIEVL